MFAYCLNNPVNGCDPCGTCFHRWEFWKDCEKCANKTFGERVLTYWGESLEMSANLMISNTSFASTVYIAKTIHYGRNLFNTNYSKEELDALGAKPLGPSEDKFHQNNQIDGRNQKYVVGNWFSSEVVFYADGTINNTPEDRGTTNVYYGNHWFGKYVIHGIYDVAPYMLWGNSPDDSTTILDRLILALR